MGREIPQFKDCIHIYFFRK